jgi:hypothetical protein
VERILQVRQYINVAHLLHAAHLLLAGLGWVGSGWVGLGWVQKYPMQPLLQQ